VNPSESIDLRMTGEIVTRDVCPPRPYLRVTCVCRPQTPSHGDSISSWNQMEPFCSYAPSLPRTETGLHCTSLPVHRACCRWVNGLNEWKDHFLMNMA
jgi:hypothetical protein